MKEFEGNALAFIPEGELFWIEPFWWYKVWEKRSTYRTQKLAKTYFHWISPRFATNRLLSTMSEHSVLVEGPFGWALSVITAVGEENHRWNRKTCLAIDLALPQKTSERCLNVQPWLITPLDWAILNIPPGDEDGKPDSFLASFSEVFRILKGLLESNGNQNPKPGGKTADGNLWKAFAVIKITNPLWGKFRSANRGHL